MTKINILRVICDCKNLSKAQRNQLALVLEELLGNFYIRETHVIFTDTQSIYNIISLDFSEVQETLSPAFKHQIHELVMAYILGAQAVTRK
jgi:hypothetical protein